MRDINQLNNTLFAQLERLSDEDLSTDELMVELERTKAISAISNTILNTANLALKAETLVSERGVVFSDSTSRLIGVE